MECVNKRRQDRASRAMQAYLANSGGDDSDWTPFIDLFTDLLHLAEAMGIDGDECYRIGRGHYTSETNEVSDEQA